MPKKVALKGNNEIQAKKILFITLSNLGDVILTTPALEAINIKYPNALIDIVGDKKSIDVFKYCPYVENLFIKNKDDGFTGLITLLKKLRLTDYDLAIDLRSDALLYFIKSKIKVHKLPNKKSMNLHSAEKHYYCLGGLVSNKLPDTKIWISSKEISIAKEKIGNIKRSKILSIGLGSRFKPKNWPVTSYADLSNKLLKYFDVVILVGNKDDSKYADKFIENYHGKVINCMGKYDIIETAALIKHSDLFIGNDSGLGHVASSVGVKTFTLFGNGEPYRYKPWGKNSEWHQDKNFEITKIKVEVIMNKIIPLLTT